MYKFEFSLKTFRSTFLAVTLAMIGTSASACPDILPARAEQILPVSYVEGASIVPAALMDELPCASEPTWSVLPDVGYLVGMLAHRDIQVLDLRSAGLRAQGMLPGTTSVTYTDWRGAAANPGLPPSEAHLSAIIGAAGLHLDAPIVIVGHDDTASAMARAAYVYWVLASLGADELAILNGGYKAWDAAGLPVVTKTRDTTPYTAKLTFGDAYLASDYEIYGIAMMQMDGRLLDVRPRGVVNRFDSQGRPIPTTLPGAQNVPVAALAAEVANMHDRDRSAKTILSHLRGHKVAAKSGPIVSFSSTGELAALNWFFASQIAGLPDVRVYAEGVGGWKARDGKLFRAANAYEMKATR